MEKSYKKLMVWHQADEFAHRVYDVTKEFPRYERFGMSAHLRRSAIAIPAKIVGATAGHAKSEMRQFIHAALSALAETEYLLEFSFRLKYIDPKGYKRLENSRRALNVLLWNFYKGI